jgi:serine/threonine protein kinase
MVLKALSGVARPRSGPQRFGEWEVLEKLGGTESYLEYRAYNRAVGRRATALLRAYQADAYQPAEEREAERRLIANAYLALSAMPGHPSIVGVRAFFPVDEGDKYILVTEDVPGQALRLHLEKPVLTLTFDQKTRIAADLLEALTHLEAYKVVHRNLTPSHLLLGADGRIRLTGFDFARAGVGNSRTIAQQIADDLETAYVAPEVYTEPAAATPSSDLFSAGLVLYELFTGDKPFVSFEVMFNSEAVFERKPSERRPDLPSGFDGWIQKLCTFDPEKRPRAADARAELQALLTPSAAPAEEPSPAPPPEPPAAPGPKLDYFDLPAQTQLTPKYIVEQRLGKPGSFGVAYKVIDTLGDVSRVIKLVLRDRHSTLDRLKKEYRTLLRIPEHPNVVRVIDADLLPGGGAPFIVFEYIDGLDVGEMIDKSRCSPEDALGLGRQVAAGLAHLHRNGVFHCDIKPRNLLWTGRGVKIIDFNVAVLAAAGEGLGGGSRRYLPPDLDLEAPPSQSDLADRDVYALGLTLYEAVTGVYPWHTAVPPPGKVAKDPRDIPSFSDLSPELVALMLKAIAPQRADRFGSAREIESAIAEVPSARRALPSADLAASWSFSEIGATTTLPPNTNPYVRHLLTVYSQSKHSNAGTRGLDVISEQTYVETALDRDLLPRVLGGELMLVIISGNAGDGKTAFLQKLERRAEDEGATVDRSLPNGARFVLQGRSYLSNYDGSQDEGDRDNDEVLRAFLGPFAGADPAMWPAQETRLIAVNEGRLVDFLEAHRGDFPALAARVSEAQSTGESAGGVVVVNLNLRSVVTAPEGTEGSILERLVQRMTHERFWTPCHGCDLKDRCYVFHNAQTFQDETAGPRVLERLENLYAVTHLRGRLHLTLRDLRSALAFTLAGTRDCDEIHALYEAGRRDEIAQGFYFNSWKGGDAPNADRLLTLLADLDVAGTDDPRLDRTLDFSAPDDDGSLFRFERRGNYDREVLRRLFDELPRDVSGRPSSHRAEAHRSFIAMARRRAFFERRDDAWRAMLPYTKAGEMLSVVRGERSADELLEPLLLAINRGEGLSRPERLGSHLALEVRRVEGGSLRSYRLYPRGRFALTVHQASQRSRFVEHMPSSLVLTYRDDAGLTAELLVTLDVFEMLARLNDGYRPSVEEEQGYYLSLAVFKNLLGSAPYQEVLLTTSGYDFYRVARQADGRLEMTRVREGAA